MSLTQGSREASRPSLQAFERRLEMVAKAAGERGIDAVLVTPGPDLAYLTGYDAKPLERLTCLVIRPGAEPVLVVPGLELLAASASPAGDLDLELVPWQESQDACVLVADLLGRASRVALDDHMRAEKVLRFRAAMPRAEQVLASSIISPLRMRKDAVEIEHLRAAGRAIDSVHAQVASFLRVGRTEAEVGRDISDAILDAGHTAVDFVIVASGPNGASPHHEVSDRRLEAGDAVVVDIGGTMPSGYCSDSTRMYALGAPTAEYLDRYEVLEAAQEASRTAVRPGVTCASVDAAGRRVLTEAGLGELFIHRTGHGIGLESHEDPYIVEGNDLLLEEGMAFSIEPGFYEAGRHGARIEDIVVCGPSDADVLNQRPRNLVIVDA
jgi:Xaa-Pro aminopeptidase